MPQELHTDAFESVWATVNFSRGLFNKPRNPAYLEKVLRALSLWDKKDAKIMTLSGGMKRRVLIAKALAHEPQILFLDEPTAGVDVELRKDMWQVVRDLRAAGVTIILTTHYIEEAEDMADRIGVINKGEIILVEDKAELMRKLGKKRLILQLAKKLDAVLPAALAAHQPDARAATAPSWCSRLRHQGRAHRRHHAAGRTERCRHARSATCIPTQSSLEEIFVGLVGEPERRHESSRRRPPSTNSRWCAPGAPLRRASCRRCISTSLYFVVFGAAIGSRITQIEGVSYGSFIVPGLIMLTLLTQSTMNASFGIYFPRFIGTIYEILSAPVSCFEIALGYRRRGGDQVDHPGADHSGDIVAVRAAAHRASRSG